MIRLKQNNEKDLQRIMAALDFSARCLQNVVSQKAMRFVLEWSVQI